MKLSTFCVLLLGCSTWVIYQQRHEMAGLKADLAASAEYAQKLQLEIAALKGSNPGSRALQQPSLTTDQGAAGSNGNWLYKKTGVNPLSTHALDTSGK